VFLYFVERFLYAADESSIPESNIITVNICEKPMLMAFADVTKVRFDWRYLYNYYSPQREDE